MIKAIAFDLDDTLLDTSGLLAPQFALATFQFMIKKGLKLSVEECEEMRKELVKTISHREVFERLAHEHGTAETVENLPEIIDHFYNPALPHDLPLMPGARENLDYLKDKYSLYLVTAGARTSQLAKAFALGIVKDFKKVIVVNSLIKHRKYDTFLQIIKDEEIQPHELLCIGNSLVSEIADALEIGAIACHFDHGESRGHVENLKRLPHFYIKTHKELIDTCKL
ncbi:MAG: superfamily hydrolase [Pseudobdellovibrio sp.]|jgi:putative hydrolase of the HAD superfamily|nr:superfamily hydrolase [Pseudobdellovibrio sp.]